MGQDDHDKGLGRKSKRDEDPALLVAASAPKVARTAEAGPASHSQVPAQNRAADVQLECRDASLQGEGAERTSDPSEQFTRLEKLGSGTYGSVYLARNNVTGAKVAIKQMRVDDAEDGIPQTAIREVALLKSLKHENVVEIITVLQPGSQRLWVVLEYVPTDLKHHLDNNCPSGFSTEMLLKYSRQLLDGLQYCHRRGVLHRDLKPQNLLIDAEKQVLKIADFGLARSYVLPTHTLTHEVVTLWYRPPEIVLGMKQYDAAVDMWSTGCILSEMATGRVLFNGESEIGHIIGIFKILGTTSPSIWPAVVSLEHFNPQFPKWQPKALTDPSHPWACIQSASFVNLLQKMLHHHPMERISAQTALNHPYYEAHNRAMENVRRSRVVASPGPDAKWVSGRAADLSASMSSES